MIYELHSSVGPKILIDDDDLTKIEENAAEFMVRVKQGIVRPPFISLIVPTGKPSEEVKREYEKDEKRNVMRLKSEKKVKVLADLMDPKLRQGLPEPKNNT